MENNSNLNDKELLLNILNKSDYKVDDKNAQIIDLNKNEIGKISRDGELITYSFSDGRKIIFNKASNEVNIYISDNYYIQFKSANDEEIFISLIMKLSNNNECCLEFNNQHLISNIVDYNVTFYHDDFEHEYESIEMSRYADTPDHIIYSYGNGIYEYTSGISIDDSVLERISDLVEGTFLYQLIMESGLINSNEGKEIINNIDYGMNIIGDSVNELINRFITYNFDEKKSMGSRKLLLLDL